MPVGCAVGSKLGVAGAADEIRHILDLWLVLVDVWKECRSGESVGRVWGSLHCGRDSALGVALTIECESEARPEAT